MPDEIFDHPRLAALYDIVEADRSDLDAYESIIAELGAQSVLDVGCGTGSLAVRLAGSGIEVIGLDPARASLDVARGKPGGDQVRWLHGEASDLPDLEVDLAVMTGNVAQVFVADDDWSATVHHLARVVGSGGHLVFESRRPEAEAWTDWAADTDPEVFEVPGVGRVRQDFAVTSVALPLVSFRYTYTFEATGEAFTSDSTLRFRELSELRRSLEVAGFQVTDVRQAPDRPGKEFVVIAQATD